MASDGKKDAETDPLLDSVTLQRMQPLAAGMRRLCRMEIFSDLDVICQGRVWKVHKFCLIAQSASLRSPTFSEMLARATLRMSFPFRTCTEGLADNVDSSEAEDDKITLDDDDPHTVEALIHYFYYFDYENWQAGTIPTIVLDARVFVIADKYFVAPLKDLALAKFDESTQECWGKGAFADAVVEVYGSTPSDSPLRRKVVDIVRRHADTLLNPENGHDGFLDVLGEIPEFGKDVCLAVTSSRLGHVMEDTYRCPDCGCIFTPDPTGRYFRCPHCDDVNSVTQSKLIFWAPQKIN